MLEKVTADNMWRKFLNLMGWYTHHYEITHADAVGIADSLAMTKSGDTATLAFPDQKIIIHIE